MSRAATLALSLLSTLVLGACQPLPKQQAAAAPAAPPAAGAPAGQQAALPAVEVRLAQREQAPALSELRLSDGSLWVLPQPVFTRADLRQVGAATDDNGRAYLQFVFTENAAPRLAALTRQYAGKFFVLTVGSNIVAVPQIGGEMAEGRLFVPVANSQYARDVAAAIVGAPAARAQAAQQPPARQQAAAQQQRAPARQQAPAQPQAPVQRQQGR